jgi:hypothetical protein
VIDKKSLTPEQLAAIDPVPAEGSPMIERLDSPDGSFNMVELIRHLLKPLESHGMKPLPRHKSEPPSITPTDAGENDHKPSTHGELLVYTVARFGDAADLADPAIRAALTPFLSSLAQVEESLHAGVAAADFCLANGVLNTRHWMAVGLLGIAHLISDQPPTTKGAETVDVPFNEQKMAIVRDKYFIPYLIALLQRLALNRAIDEAGELASSAEDDAAAQLASLRTGLLRFAVGGHFTHISTRQVLHRYYQIVREGLDVPVLWEEVRRAIADIATNEVTRKIDQNLGLVAHVQVMVEWIEIFLVSVYAAHLWHMFAEKFPLFPEEAREWIVSLGVPSLALIAGGIAFWILNPMKLKTAHSHHGAQDRPASGSNGHI